MFSFISIIEFIVPHTPSFSIHLLEKGLEGSSYRISFKEKLSGHLKSIERLGSLPRDRNEKLRCLCRLHQTAVESGPATNVGPEPRTDMSDKSSPSLTPLR